MNLKKTLLQALKAAQNREYKSAETLARKILLKKPHHADALLILGTSLSEQGKNDLGITFLKKAISRNSYNPSAFNNLGHAYLKTGDFKKSLPLFEHAIKLKPNYCEALNNLGKTHLKLKEYDKAELLFHKSLDVNRYFTSAKDNLGVCYMEQGRLQESLQELLAAYENNQDIPSVYLHLASLLMYMHSTDDAEKVIDAGLGLQNLSYEARYMMLTQRALLSWITGNPGKSSEALREIEAITTEQVIVNAISESIPFSNYLKKLLKVRKKHPELYNGSPERAIFFIAESHCLTPSEMVVRLGVECEQFRVLSAIIVGCKAFHLSSSKNNKYKQSLKIILSALPENSIVVCGFGEIDCRIDEGILPAFLDKRISFKESIAETVRCYISYAHELSKGRNHRLIIYGVPAPSRGILKNAPQGRAKLLCEIRKCFNESLMNVCMEYHLEMLDIYAMTTTEGNTGNPNCFLENHHIHPRIIPELFSSFLHTN